MGDLTGILNVNKPLGWTSHDVVARVRRLAGQRRVGHAGTLDPLAEGVLPVLLGRATRLADVIQSGRKTYQAVVCLGRATTTDDAEGEVIASQPVPLLIQDHLEIVLTQFRGQILQTPPAFSALKVGGRRAYAIARTGADVTLPRRPVTIDALRLLACAPDTLTLEVTCSKGTYIRALARDIAATLGTVGHLASLVRTRVGPFLLADAVSLDDLAPRSAATADDSAAHGDDSDARLDVPSHARRGAQRTRGGPPAASGPAAPRTPNSRSPLPPAAERSDRAAASPLHSRRALIDVLFPPSAAIPDAPTFPATPDQASRLANGQPVPSPGLRADHVWVYDPHGHLLCLATADGGVLRPRIAL